MVTSQECFKKYGDPENPATQSKWFELWIVPDYIRREFSHVIFSALGTQGFPKKIFLNKDLRIPLEKALNNVIARQMTGMLKTWDGCFIIRQKRGLKSMSLHSWAIAIDINASENRLGQQPNLHPSFVKCFTDAGLEWGGLWKRKDGMHFQLSHI